MIVTDSQIENCQALWVKEKRFTQFWFVFALLFYRSVKKNPLTAYCQGVFTALECGQSNIYSKYVVLLTLHFD
jgi:hypothetical protein